MTIRDDLGLLSGEIEEIDQMPTAPLRWPNNMAEARDEAAEHVSAANREIDNLVKRYALTPEIFVELLKIRTHQVDALRWLESAGAPTRPEHL